MKLYYKLYWFTVEFGICKENGKIKAYGAGLLSAYGELQYALSGKPDLIPLRVEKAALQEYQDKKYQSVYFLAENFDEAKQQFKSYSKDIKKPFKVIYDPFTQSIKIIENFALN
jgi:phenylalanine-4-hydroxylase